MDKQFIQEAMKTVSPELTWLFGQALLALFGFYFMKSLATSILNWCILRGSLWGRNTKILIEGRVGYIRKICFKEVVIAINTNEEMYIPVEKFLKSTKVVYHNGYVGDRENKK